MVGSAKGGAKGASKGAAVASKAKSAKNQHSLGTLQHLLQRKGMNSLLTLDLFVD